MKERHGNVQWPPCRETGWKCSWPCVHGPPTDGARLEQQFGLCPVATKYIFQTCGPRREPNVGGPWMKDRCLQPRCINRFHDLISDRVLGWEFRGLSSWIRALWPGVRWPSGTRTVEHKSRNLVARLPPPSHGTIQPGASGVAWSTHSASCSNGAAS